MPATYSPLKPTDIHLSYDHRTAWRHAYNVYRGADLLGLVYRGSDLRWRVVAEDGRKEVAFARRRDAVSYLTAA